MTFLNMNINENDHLDFCTVVATESIVDYAPEDLAYVDSLRLVLMRNNVSGL